MYQLNLVLTLIKIYVITNLSCFYDFFLLFSIYFYFEKITRSTLISSQLLSWSYTNNWKQISGVMWLASFLGLRPWA